MEDAGLCMEAGRKLPAQMRGQAGSEGEGNGTLVGILEIWIREFEPFAGVEDVFPRPERRKSNRHSLLGGSERSELSSPVVT